ncbi:MAG: AraC family transcriptional regulator [Planctomycetota bacterium]
MAPASKPAADAVLCADFADRPNADAWFNQSHEQDALWSTALTQGVATGQADAGHDLAAAGDHVLLVTWRASAGGPLDRDADATVWYAVLCRPDRAWSPQEQRHVRLTLRRMQAIWDHPAEAGVGRWLLGADGRVLHADAQTQATWPMTGVPAPAWATQVHDVIRQRWVGATDERCYDMVFDRAEASNDSVDHPAAPASDEPSAAPEAEWVRLFHRPPTAGLSGGDYVETRPVDTNDSPPIGAVDDPRVGTALGYLIDRHAESPGLKDVASVVQSSPFHFHRLFSRIVGVSPKNYLLRTQLQMAKWRLRTGTQPVGDVATAAGFASHGHFTATFHRIVGESPTDYRDRHAQHQLG